MRKAILLGLTAIVYVLLSVNASVDKLHYKIAVVPWVGWSPVHVAEAMGFWRDLGVDVEVVNMESNIQMYQALIAGDVTIQFDMLGTAVGRYQEGHPVAIIAETDWSDGGDKIIAKRDLDLIAHKHNTVGVYLDAPSLSYFLNLYLSSHGLQAADFTLQQETPADGLTMFVDGKFKILMAYDPFATTAVENGKGEVVATSADYPGSVPEGMLMLQTTYQQTPKADLEKIIPGWVKAVVWINEPGNWQQYQQILNDRTFAGDNPRSDAELKKLLGEVRIHSPQQMFERNKKGGATEAFLEDMCLFLKANHMLKRDFSPDQIFANDVVHAALINQEPGKLESK